jgi:tRNA U55 pseudouridine synthase TruB
LARDLAKAASSCAHLIKLKRTSIARFSLEQAINPSTENNPHEAIRNALKPVDKQMFQALNIPMITVDDKTADAFINGKPINMVPGTQNALGCIQKDNTHPLSLAIFRQNGTFVGIIRKENNIWHYGYMYAAKNVSQI